MATLLQIIRAFEKMVDTRFPVRLEAMSGGESAGVRLVAASAIPAGAVVYFDRPLISIAVRRRRRRRASGPRPAIHAGIAPLPPHQQDRRWCYHCVRPLPPTPVRCSGHSHAQTPAAAEAGSDAPASSSTCDRLYCSAACAASAWEQYHEPLCGLDLARIEAYAAQGVTTTACFILFTWKMLGFAIQRQRRRGSGAPLESPADVSPFCHLARISDVGSAAKLLEAGLGDFKGGVAGPLHQWLMIREMLGPAFVKEPALSVSRAR